jgi:hypothetical protein
MIRQRLHADREHGRQVAHDRLPVVARVRRDVDLAAGGAEVHAAGIERVDRHRVAQHVHVAVFLRQAVGQRLPGVAAGAAAVHAQLALGRVVLRVALDRHDVDGVRFVRVHRHGETEIAGQIAADLEPRVAGIVAAHHVPVLLHEERVRPRRMHGDAVHAVADFGFRVGDVLRMQAAVDRPPRRAAVVAAERAGRRDRHVHPRRVRRVEQDGVQAHAAGARHPFRALLFAQAGQLLPGLPAVGRAEQRGVLDPGVDRVRVGRRRLQMPHALELPRASACRRNAGACPGRRRS